MVQAWAILKSNGHLGCKHALVFDTRDVFVCVLHFEFRCKRGTIV